MRAILVLVFLSLTCSPTRAMNIAQCGASKGWAYFSSNNLVGNGPGLDKWVQDGISNGRITLAKGTDNSYDLLYGDSLSPINSASKDGALVAKIGELRGTLSILVSYPNRSVETYTFRKRPDGSNEVLWTAIKYGTAITTARAMRATCEFLAIQ